MHRVRYRKLPIDGVQWQDTAFPDVWQAGRECIKMITISFDEVARLPKKNALRVIEKDEREKGEGPTSKREQNKREKRSRILEAARSLFAEQGFEETTGRQVCERAGVATGTLFLYVKDKRELLLWVFERDARRILSRPLPKRGRPDERWFAFLSPFLTLYARDPRLSSSYVRELLFRPDNPPELVRLNRELRAGLADIARAAQAEGALRSDVEPEEMALLVAGQYAYLVQVWLGLGALGARQVRSQLRRGLALLVEGLKS